MSGDEWELYDSDYNDYENDHYDDYNYDYDSDGLEIRHYLGSRRYQNYGFDVSSTLGVPRYPEYQGSDSKDECSEDPSLTVAQDQTHQRDVPSLVDLSSRFVALNFPFAYIEHREPPVPEELQLKIISFAFPDNKQTVMKFVTFSREDASLRTVERLSRQVKELHQIGFRLSASVAGNSVVRIHSVLGRDVDFSHDKLPFVTVYFDRGKITEAYCTACDISDVGWCDHVLAVIMARINKKSTCKIYPPVSDSLNQLNREQLLKFSQYLLTDHHKKPTILESAQDLLNKLLKPHKCQSNTFGTGKADEGVAQAGEEDLNSIPGAPDATAGPGMADKAHWFLCKKSFGAQSDFRRLSLKEMGFFAGAKDHFQAPLPWSKCKTLQGFVLDGLEAWIEEDHPYKHNLLMDWDHEYGMRKMIRTNVTKSSFDTSTSRKEVSAAYEMLKNDYGTAMAAIVCWTEDVFNRETKYPTTRRINVQAQQRKLYVMTKGLEHQYTPRPFSWNKSCDLAKLWRVAVLNPRLTKGNREGIAHQLREKARKSFAENELQTMKPWPGFIAIKLLQLDLHGPELQALCQGNTEVLPEVCSCSDKPLQGNMQFTSCGNTEDSKKNEEKAEDDRTDYSGNVVSDSTQSRPQQMVEDSLCALVSRIESMKLSAETGESTRLCIPLFLRCGDILHDVNTYLAIAEALKIYGHTVPATYLSCAISFALLKFYHECIQGTSDYYTRQMENVNVSCDRENEVTFSAPLSLPNVALLYSIISSEANTVENWWQNLEKTSLIETVSSSASFVFQVGILGLLIPVSPAASPELEGDNFHHDKWLVHHLLASRPVENDLKFLGQCLGVMSNNPGQLSLSISLAHLLFHHSFKEASGIEFFQAMTGVQQSVMEGTISVLGLSISCRSQLAALWRKVAHFAKEVLQVTVTCLSLHERVIEKLIQPNGLFGENTLRRWSVADQSSPVERSINDVAGADFDAKNALYALAMALVATSCCRDNVKVVEETNERENADHDEKTKVLRKSQITLLMHALSLPASSRFRRDIVFGDLLNVLQVEDFEENVKHLQGLRCDFADAFNAGEVLQICDKLLEEKDAKSLLKKDAKSLQEKDAKSLQEKDVKSRDLAETVLTEFVKRKASAGDAEMELSRVIEWFDPVLNSFSRLSKSEKNRRLSLLPGVCQQILPFCNSGKVSFKVLSKAATSLQSYAKVAAERKSVSKSSTTVKTVTDLDSLQQTAFDLGVSSLQCVEKWWQESNGRTDGCRMVTRSLRDICQMVKDLSKDCVSEHNRTRYLDKFLTVALATIETPTWMFLIVEEIAPMFPAISKSSSRTRHWQHRQETEIRDACSQSHLLTQLLERCCKAFEELLRGPELNQKLEQLSQEDPFNGRRGPFGQTWRETRAFDKVKINGGLTLRECLRQTKRIYLALYAKGRSTAAFRLLFKELESAHPILSAIAREYTSD